DKFYRQSEKIRSACKHPGLFVDAVRRANKEGIRKFAGGKNLNLAPLRLDRRSRSEYARAAVECRRKRHCAEAIHRVQYVVIIAVQARPFEHRRYSNRHRKADAVGLLKAPHELGSPESAVTFANDCNDGCPHLMELLRRLWCQINSYRLTSPLGSGP